MELNPNFTTWDDIFSADYPDHRLRKMVTVGVVIDKYENDLKTLYEN